jgi:hypothetical protein
MSKGWWELIFLMLVMKLPIAYLSAVVWWAVKAEPRPEEGAARLAELPTEPPSRYTPWRPRRRPPHAGPHGSPTRRAPRVPRVARAEMKPE